LQLLLFETERAWAYAQELLEVFAKSDDTSDRTRAMGRVRRALSWAARLLSQCKVLFDAGRLKATHYAEVATYELLIKGRFQRIREEYDVGVASLAVARNMLDEFAANATTSHDQAIATVFIDDVAPEIRHCAHSLGHKRAYEIDSIVKEVAPRHRLSLIPQYEQLVQAIHSEQGSGSDGKASGILRNLKWEGEVVPIRNPELVDAFLKVESASAKLAENQGPNDGSTQTKSRKNVNAFDGILQALSDAEDIARKLSEARRLSGGTDSATANTGTGTTRDIHFVHSYTTYQLLARRTQRDLLLVNALASDSSKHKSSGATVTEDPRVNPAIVKIYDTVLQSLNRMRTLTIVDESPDVATATEARIAYIKAARSVISFVFASQMLILDRFGRCLFMARAYAHLKRYAEAVSLTQTGQVRIREARYQTSLLSSPAPTPETQYFPVSENLIISLEGLIEQEETKRKVEWFSYNGGSVKGETDTSVKKPLFYDIAYNELEDPLEKVQRRAGRKVETKKPTPSAVSAVAQQQATKAKVDETPEAEPEAEQARAGVLSGLLGGWWGRR
jgi:signal recognition particle subunit SRP68